MDDDGFGFGYKQPWWDSVLVVVFGMIVLPWLWIDVTRERIIDKIRGVK